MLVRSKEPQRPVQRVPPMQTQQINASQHGTYFITNLKNIYLFCIVMSTIVGTKPIDIQNITLEYPKMFKISYILMCSSFFCRKQRCFWTLGNGIRDAICKNVNIPTKW